MRVSELAPSELERRLDDGSLRLDLNQFVASIASDVPRVAHDLRLMYGEFELADSDGFADFHIEVRRERGLRGWARPLARFFYDGRPSFVPLPAQHGFTMIEWGLNWCVASHAHQFLVMHAAVLERDGRALVMPAPPGAGKSTLCAALALRGWRLLSDELALYDMAARTLHGMARPVNLKNASIALIQTFEPAAVLTQPVPDTAKGTVALMRAPADSVARAHEPALPAWIVLPRYRPQAEAQLRRHDRSQTLLLLAEQSFNYDIHGERGFDALVDLVGRCSCFDFGYSRLDDAIDQFERLAAGEIE